MRALANVAALAGAALLGALLWATLARLRYWDVRSFVLLYYAAGLCAVLATLGGWLSSRRPGLLVRRAETVLTTAVIVLGMWFWVPAVRPLVSFAIRSVSATFLR